MLGPAVDAGSDVAGVFALQELGDTAGVLDNLHAALEFAHGVIDDLAVFFGDCRSNLLRVLVEELLEAEHDACALAHGCVPPTVEGCLGSVDGTFYGVGRCEGHFAYDLPRCRISDGKHPACLRDELAVYEMTDRLERDSKFSGAAVPALGLLLSRAGRAQAVVSMTCRMRSNARVQSSTLELRKGENCSVSAPLRSITCSSQKQRLCTSRPRAPEHLLGARAR